MELYENIEGIPNVELTAQKVLDGYPLLYHLATPDATAPSLAGRSNARCFVAINIYPDTNDNASGSPLTAMGMSGMYVSKLSYTLNVEGNSVEDVTLVGNDKVWKGAGGYASFLPNFNGTDAPLSLASSGGVQRREDVLMTGTPMARMAARHPRHHVLGYESGRGGRWLLRAPPDGHDLDRLGPDRAVRAGSAGSLLPVYRVPDRSRPVRST